MTREYVITNGGFPRDNPLQRILLKVKTEDKEVNLGVHTKSLFLSGEVDISGKYPQIHFYGRMQSFTLTQDGNNGTSISVNPTKKIAQGIYVNSKDMLELLLEEGKIPEDKTSLVEQFLGSIAKDIAQSEYEHKESLNSMRERLGLVYNSY